METRSIAVIVVGIAERIAGMLIAVPIGVVETSNKRRNAMQVTVRTERSLVEIENVVEWFHGVDSSLVVMSRSEDGKETIRRCWRNWVYFDVVTQEDEKPAETAMESGEESEDGNELLKLADHALRLAQANSGERRHHNVTVALTDLEEWAKLVGMDIEYLELTPDSDPEWNLNEARKAIREELRDSPRYSVIPIAIAHLRAVLEHMKGEKPEEQKQSEGNPGISDLLQYMAGDSAVPGTKTVQVCHGGYRDLFRD